MGKAQSKRSVDITTEGKKDEEVIAGKVEKIEDIEDQKPQVNGDATPQENDAKEKKDTEESENDKDATTEKSSGDAGGGGGDQAQQNGEHSAEEAAAGATTPKEETKEGGAGEEEISPLADDSSKKTKKEKVKKKWSFRSISFGKKDKQKPAKTDAEAVSPTTNGEATDKPIEGANADETNNEDGAAKPPTENGEASEKELLNGGDDTTTTTPTEDKSATVATANESTNDTAAAVAATTTNNTTASSSTTTSPSTAPVVADNQTDKKVAAEVAAPILSNGTAEEKPDIISPPEQAVEKPQQNGTNGEEHADEDDETHAVEIKTSSKSIESDIKIDATNINEDTSVGGDGAGDSFISSAITPTTLIIEPKAFEQIGACGDVVETKQTEIVITEPPPLPISPPPSQVVAFALNNEVPNTELEQLEKRVQAPRVSIAEIEEDFQEQPTEESSNKIEVENIELVAEINKKVLEDNNEHKMKAEQNETFKAETETNDMFEEKQLEATAAATFFVDEITSKAAEYVYEMKKQHLNMQAQEEQEEILEDKMKVKQNETVNVENETHDISDENKLEDDVEVVTINLSGMTIENVIDMANRYVNTQSEEYLEEEFLEEYYDEELPPPPPTPPTVDETELENNEPNAHEEVVASVEEVLNQFETKISEIEEKVMNLAATSLENEEDTSSIIEVSDTETMQTQQSKIDCTINSENINENETAKTDKTNTNVNNEIEILQRLNDETNEIQEEVFSDVKEFDTNENETAEQIEEEFSEAQQFDNVETNKMETSDYDVEEEFSEAKQIETNVNETAECIEYELEKQHDNIDITEIIVDELNKLKLNNENNIVQENNDNTQKAIEQSDVENKNLNTIDLKTVKEINPIELKEAAAAAEIKTQDLAVSCE